MNGCDASDWSGWSSAKWYLCYGHTNCSCPLHMLSARTHLTMFHACGLAAVSCRLTVPWVLRSSPTIQLHFPILHVYHYVPFCVAQSVACQTGVDGPRVTLPVVWAPSSGSGQCPRARRPCVATLTSWTNRYATDPTVVGV